MRRPIVPPYVTDPRRLVLFREAVNPNWQLKDERGRQLCRWCGSRLEGRRTSFCSGGRVGVSRDGELKNADAWGCVEEWQLRTNAQWRRQVVFARDRGACQSCGLDCAALLADRYREGETRVDRHVRLAPLRALFGADGHTWEVDHVLAIHKGGGGALANLRTLCLACHREKSVAERRL